MRAEVVRELQTWPIEERLQVAEELLRLIRSEVSTGTPARRSAVRRKMKQAASALLSDYANDEELTAFTALDGDDFHAAG